MSRLRSAVALVLAAIAWAASASAAHGAGWLDGPTFGGRDAPAHGSFDVAADGTATIAWSAPDTPGGSPTLRLRQLASDGAPGTERRLGAAEAWAEPAVAVTPRGDGVVAWLSPGDIVNVARVTADGAVGATQQLGVAWPGMLAAGIDEAGDATVAWTGFANESPAPMVHVRRVRADGTLTTERELPAPDAANLQVAVSPGGLSWVAWSAPPAPLADPAVWAVRLDAGGAISAAPQALSPEGVLTRNPVLSASAAGAAITWSGGTGLDSHMGGVRLPATGGLAGAALPFPATMGRLPSATTNAIAADGTVTAVWPVEAPGPSSVLAFRRFPPNAPPTAVQQLAQQGPEFSNDDAPTLAHASDGALLLASIRWLDFPPNVDPELLVRRIEADGAVGAEQVLGPAAFFGWLRLEADARGGALLGSYRGGHPDDAAYDLHLFDGGRPWVEAAIPAAAEVGAAAAFSVAASDRSGIASIAWSFGDGATASGAAATHAYGEPGERTVTVTVRDRAGEETVVSRVVRVAPRPVVVPPGDRPRGPGTARAAARLKIAAVARRGARVTVRGTIARSAGGRVTVTWSQKAGRRTVVRKATGRIASGRWTATVRLTRALARARAGRATVKVAYKGDADTKAASAKRTVTAGRGTAGKRRR